MNTYTEWPTEIYDWSAEDDCHSTNLGLDAPLAEAPSLAPETVGGLAATGRSIEDGDAPDEWDAVFGADSEVDGDVDVPESDGFFSGFSTIQWVSMGMGYVASSAYKNHMESKGMEAIFSEGMLAATGEYLVTYCGFVVVDNYESKYHARRDKSDS